MLQTRHTAFAVLTGILHGLHPARTNRRPALFILQVATALLSVLALRDRILGNPAMWLEALLAAVLWVTLLAIGCTLLRADRRHLTQTG